jgi:hypothetical protein
MPALPSFRTRLILIGTALIALVATGFGAGPGGEPASRPMQQGRFGLKAADFFRNPEAALTSGVALLMKEGFRGLALDAPDAISVAERDSCPALLAEIGLARTLRASPLEQQGMLVVTDLRRHRTLVGPVVQPRDAFADERPLGEPSATQLSARSYQVDLRARLSLPWEASELRVQVVSGDRLSNQVGISLRAGAKAVAVPAPSPPPVFPQPKDRLPSYDKSPSSPAPPSQPGFQIVRGAPQETGLPVYGAFLVPRNAVQIVSAEQAKSYRAPAPFGMVTIALVLTGSGARAPQKLEVNVPVFLTASESAQQDRFVGYFALDLASQIRGVDTSRPLFLYAFCDELRTGPIPLGTAQ